MKLADEFRKYKKAMTVKEVAEILGVTAKTITLMRLSGQIPFVRIGMKLIRFDPDEMAQWVELRANAKATSTKTTRDV